MRAAQGRSNDAITNYEQSLVSVPTQDAVIGLGDLLVSLNRPYDAAKVFQIIDTIEKINRANGVESGALGALFYADHHHDLDEALRIATACAKDRQDGIVPCPSALIVLLSAIALHRIVLGLTLIVSFSAGVASVLIVIGVLIVGARRTLDRFAMKEAWMRGVPFIASAVVALLGAAISWQAISAAGTFK